MGQNDWIPTVSVRIEGAGDVSVRIEGAGNVAYIFGGWDTIAL